MGTRRSSAVGAFHLNVISISREPLGLLAEGKGRRLVAVS